MVKDYNRIPQYKLALQSAMAGALRNVGDDALDAIDKGFDNGTAPDGTPWAPLAPSTVEQTGSDILIDEGDLRESFDTEVHWSPVGDKKLVIYSEDPKLKYHEFGTVNMPRRPVLEPTARVVGNDLLPEELVAAAKRAERAAGVTGR